MLLRTGAEAERKLEAYRDYLYHLDQARLPAAPMRGPVPYSGVPLPYRDYLYRPPRPGCVALGHTTERARGSRGGGPLLWGLDARARTQMRIDTYGRIDARTCACAQASSALENYMGEVYRGIDCKVSHELYQV